MWLHCKIEPKKKLKNDINTKFEKYRDLVWVLGFFWGNFLHVFM
jgi:hypothetical protein